MSQDQQPVSKVRPRAEATGTRWNHALVGMIAGLAAALILDSLLRLVLAAAMGVDPRRLSLTLGAFFIAGWALLSVLFVWKAASVGSVLWRSLLVVSLEWLAVGTTSMALGPRLAPAAGGYAVSGLTLLDSSAQRIGVFFQVNALLAFVLGFVFLIAAFFAFRDTYERS